MTDVRETASARRKRLALTGLMLVWFLVAAGVILWQTVAYRGIAAAVAEWEFARFGRYYPWATLMVLIGLFSLPPIYFLFRRERRPADHVATLPEVQSRGLRFLRQLTICAIACAGAGLVALSLILTLPGVGGSPARIDPRVAGEPASGPAILSGPIRYDRVATLDSHLLFVNRTIRFVPVEPAVGTPLRYFVEVDALPESGEVPAPPRGLLRKGGLPGEIRQLYRDAGYVVDSPHYVLFNSVTSMRWPFYVIACHFFLLALVLAGAALFQRRNNARLAKQAGHYGQTV